MAKSNAAKKEVAPEVQMTDLERFAQAFEPALKKFIADNGFTGKDANNRLAALAFLKAKPYTDRTTGEVSPGYSSRINANDAGWIVALIAKVNKHVGDGLTLVSPKEIGADGYEPAEGVRPVIMKHFFTKEQAAEVEASKAANGGKLPENFKVTGNVPFVMEYWKEGQSFVQKLDNTNEASGPRM